MCWRARDGEMLLPGMEMGLYINPTLIFSHILHMLGWEVTMLSEKVLRPDAKGRICLGKLAEGVSSFRVSVDERRRIVLEPYAEIPATEKWLFDNPDARESVRRGLVDVAEGRVADRGSVSEYDDDSDG